MDRRLIFYYYYFLKGDIIQHSTCLLIFIVEIMHTSYLPSNSLNLIVAKKLLKIKNLQFTNLSDLGKRRINSLENIKISLRIIQR